MTTGLVKSAHLNQCHGTVVDDESAEGTVIVDLDVRPKRFKIKTQNVEREAPLPEDGRRAKVNEGILEELDGRAMNLLLEVVRVVAATECCYEPDVDSLEALARIRQQPTGMWKINQYTSRAWSNWKKVKHLVKSHMLENMETKSENNEPVPEYATLAHEALEDVRAMASWHIRIHGDFWVVGYDESGAYLIPKANRKSVYKCVGIRNALGPMIFNKRPDAPIMLFTTTMIAWYGRLVYDGVLLPGEAQFGKPKEASSALARALRENVEQAKAEGRVIERLAQLEVPGGNVTGAIREGASEPDLDAQEPPPQAEATQEEIKLIQKLAKITPSQTGSNQEYWVFRRMDYTEHGNPNHFGMIMAGAFIVGPFYCSALIPSSADILKALVEYSQKAKCRPRVIGVDDYNCTMRLKELIKDTPAFQVVYYPPPSEEEQASAMAMGPNPF